MTSESRGVNMANYKSPNLDNGEKEEGKKKLNPKIIHRTLISSHQKGIKMLLAFLLLCEIIFVPLGILVSNIDSFEPGWDIVIIFGFSALPAILFGVSIISLYRSMQKITKGSYSLITDTIERVVTDDKYVYRRRMHGWSGYYEHAMYLYRCGRVVISLEETYLNSEGDACYVLVYDDKPDEAVAVFNSKFYELEDIEEPTEE